MGVNLIRHGAVKKVMPSYGAGHF
ncbi:hypothetical protein LUTEI9C_80336 [Luteimonas sp. 9C]|nr:hypothetical protein LUTEI9C_80336 [Luteimonas sp. 9C]